MAPVVPTPVGPVGPVSPVTPAEPEGPDHLEHDVEHSGLCLVRRKRPDAGHGPEGPGRGQGARSQERLCQPPVHGTADSESLSATHSPDAARPMARPGQPGVQTRKPGRLHPDAGSERAWRERQAGEVGPEC